MQGLKNALQLYFNDFNRYPTLSPTNEFTGTCATCLTPEYMRELPDAFGGTPTAIYEPTPPGEYRAGVVLSEFATPDKDVAGTRTTCDKPNPPGLLPTTGIWPDGDFFICPD